GQRNPDQADQRTVLVARVAAARALPQAEPERPLGHLVDLAAHQVAQRVAAEGVAGEQDDVEEKHQAADVDVEAVLPAEEAEVGVVAEEDEEQEREVKEVAVD